ncbi:MAG TPA: MBL fold metallo-hydrolase [Gemmatimonadaceae bacterium]|nr:MBL fold metallo-hydrolase [Gemmatimonadaceae bacterium]
MRQVHRLSLALAALASLACVSAPGRGRSAPAVPPDSAAAAAPRDSAPSPEAARARAVAAQRAAMGLVRITDDIAVIIGAGGNVAVSTGEDGLFLVDDKVVQVTMGLVSMLDSLDTRPVRYVVNTHWHTDHTGGNEALRRAGAVVIAHESVRKRMSERQVMREIGDTVPAAPASALPTLTFGRAMSLHVNGDDVELLHLPAAHTDGDVVVRWRKANVVHAGDIYFNREYPLIDLSTGGSLDGMIAAVDSILSVSDEHTRIIPGHGPLSNARELRAYRDMLDSVRTRLRKAIAAKHTVEQVVAAGLTKEWDAAWGGGFIKPDLFAAIAYESVRRSPPEPRKRRVADR